MLARRLVYTLDAAGSYNDEAVPPQFAVDAVAAYAPALILRKRSQQGLVEIFQTIVAQLAEADDVPSGLLPLVDPDREPTAETDPTPGAVVAVGDEIFLPLPVNEQQLKILKAVDARAQTVVQGPPGTGKTHTAAALLSHLLAQGKRVLVAAHTDRALKEVRDKLPTAIKPLSVAVVGNSRSDMSDLKFAVEKIAAVASEHDPLVARKTMDASLTKIDDLRRKRAATHRQLIDARAHEVVDHEFGIYSGSLAAIAQRYQAEAEDYGWLTDLVEVSSDDTPPLTDAEIAEWRSLLLDVEFQADEPDSQDRILELDGIPQPHEFADLCVIERTAAAISQQHADLVQHEEFEAVRRLQPEERARLQQRMRALANEALVLEQRREAWMNDALYDIRASRGALWRARADQVGTLINQALPMIEALGPLTEVDLADSADVAALASLAQALRQHLRSGGAIKTSGDGKPKIGMLTPKMVKEALPLFEHVRINGLPPVEEEQLISFITYVDAARTVDALDRAWPANVLIPTEDTLDERLQWHVIELEQLARVLTLGEELVEEERRLIALGLKRPDWTDLEAIHAYASLVDAAAASDAWADARRPLRALEEAVETAARWGDAAACVHQLHLAIRNRDYDEYSRGYARLSRLNAVRALATRRDELGAKLSAAPDLRECLLRSAAERIWDDRLPRFEAAWMWAATGAWILQQDTTDANALQAQIGVYEGRIRREVETLAATRAWSHAVSTERLTGQSRADLALYASLVRRLGKGTGKYAAQKRAEIRTAMDRCRPAVPVWIMPIYRIAEQFKVHENMFDVVIVDEASQAGLEATFLQYLAPKIVVIGDDKQVSPTAVGVDQQQLRDLANQYLARDRYKAAWQDPKRSLFDEALMRYGGQITLVEHRRCVPEIIGFSNRIAYEPDGIRLIPVRQYGADRLEPIRAVHVVDGYERGTSAKINPAEVAAIVDQIEKCLVDPRYDGLTFGVISLLGTAQAKAIESELLERIPPDEWTARDLRCGDAADFQGSERDVIFLSMVAAASPGRRLGALTQELYVQRYNVAASRAKDQLWLFHSVAPGDLGNPEDMRFALLDYCYGVINRAHAHDEGVGTEAVPENTLVDPFDSLFEQRVFNRLFDRGYTVIPQYPAEGYKIDLVVVGARGRLAIECDGDTWHGPDAYEADLARQRDLERCGWQFFRIRESAFYVDQAGSLDMLWQTLNELRIHPSGWIEEELGGDEGIEVPDWDSVSDDNGDHGTASTQDPAAAVAVPTHALPPSIAELAGHDDHVPTRVLTYDPADLGGPTHLYPSLGDGVLEPYTEFTGTVAQPANASRQQLLDGLLAVVAVQGPIDGHRLHTAYVKASGGKRVGKAVAKILNSAITAGVRQGKLLVDNPLHEAGVKPRTYRLPDQLEVRLRELGPRTLEQVPPRELAALLSRAANEYGWDNNETLFRAVLASLGLHRLTANVEARMLSVLPIVAPDGGDS
nr:AAA domain-containing protein [Jiangella mangrovi]